MDTSAEDESNDGDHGAMSPSSGNEDPSSPRSTPSHTKVGTSPRGTPLDVTKLAAVIDEIEADMVDDDADAARRLRGACALPSFIIRFRFRFRFRFRNLHHRRQVQLRAG